MSLCCRRHARFLSTSRAARGCRVAPTRNKKPFGAFFVADPPRARRVSDYVTEKVYNGLQAGTLPVYWGASNIEAYVPRGSVVKVSGASPFPLSASRAGARADAWRCAVDGRMLLASRADRGGWGGRTGGRRAWPLATGKPHGGVVGRREETSASRAPGCGVVRRGLAGMGGTVQVLLDDGGFCGGGSWSTDLEYDLMQQQQPPPLPLTLTPVGVFDVAEGLVLPHPTPSYPRPPTLASWNSVGFGFQGPGRARRAPQDAC